MENRFFEHPILNSPYEYPPRHWEMDASGQRRFFIGSRHVREVAIVSARALMVDSPLISFKSLVKNGTRPQRARMSSRSPVSLL